MNIRHRITLLVVLTFVSISLIGGYAILQSRWNASQVKVVTEGVIPSALASADLVSRLKDVQLATLAVVSAPDRTVAAQAAEKLANDKKLLQEAIELQRKQASDDAQRGLVDQAEESLTNYFSAIKQATQLAIAGQRDLAEATLYATVNEYQNELGAIVNTLRVEKNRTKDNAITNLNNSLAGTITTISAVTVFAVIVLSAIGIVLYLQITRPLRRMQEEMSEIASSQDFTRRVPVGQMDEIGLSINAFNTMIAKIEESSELLKQKTNDIQTMLQNMPQGILTVAVGNKVHPEYSAYLETIFETSDIADRDMMDLVFGGTHVGADTLAQLEAVVEACIGQDEMNFGFNMHLLVGEIEKTMPDGRVKILDLNWSPITDSSDTTVRLLLCVRDVTELRALAEEASVQRRELAIIGEILAVTQEKFHEFIGTSIKFVDENELLIRDHTTHNVDAITQLFRNMHTIKGNARTYGLRHLTDALHRAEQSYDELRKTRPNRAWDQGVLLDELAEVRNLIEQYARINEVSLGRKGPGRRGNVERFLMVDRVQIQSTLHRLETVNTGNIHELVAARDAVRNTLRLLGTEPISEALSGVFDSLPSLANELGKLPPIVEINDNGFVIRNQASGLLKNVFMHLIRNAVDHGIETPEVRISQNKLAAGTIRLHMDVVDNMLRIRLADDGRGLALSHIRKMANIKGLIGADSTVSDEDIARQIFLPGFSTAEKVTEVSGRGVGMDAVQDFLKRENGKIEIRFVDDRVGADFRQFEMIVSLPDSFTAHADLSDFHPVEDSVRDTSRSAVAAETTPSAHAALVSA